MNNVTQTSQIAVKPAIKKVKKIKYLKINPFILGKLQNYRNFKLFYNIYKYGLCIVTAVFVLTSLLFVSRWQSNAFTNLGLAQITYNNLKANLGTTAFNALGVNSWNNVGISSKTFSVLIVFSFINIFLLLYTLVFKNGTLFSISFMLVLTIFLLVVIIIFFLAYTDPTLTKAIKMYKDFNTNLSIKLQKVHQNMQKSVFDTLVNAFNIKLGALVGYVPKMLN